MMFQEHLARQTMTSIELTDQEAELFLKFRQHQDQFNKLVECDFFSIKGAPGIVHFDEHSNIRKIEVPQIRVYNITSINIKSNA